MASFAPEIYASMDKKSFIVREVEFNDLAEAVAEKVIAMMKDSIALTSSKNARGEDDESLISTKEACRILACGERTLQRYRASRLVSVIYRGPHRCFYYRDEILSLRDANTRPNRDSK